MPNQNSTIGTKVEHTYLAAMELAQAAIASFHPRWQTTFITKESKNTADMQINGVDNW